MVPTDGTSAPGDAIEADIQREANRLFIRSEAKRRIDAEERDDATERRTFTIVPAADDIATTEDEVRDIVTGILPAGCIVLFTAQHKTGKTTFLLNLIHALLRGETFLGYTVPQSYPRGILYVNADMSPRAFREWLRALHLGVPNFYVLNDAPDLANPADVAALAALLVTLDIGIVIFDVWGAVFSGDENSNTEVRHAMNNLGRLRADANLDAAVVVHHTGWSEDSKKRARGASAIEGAVDVLWRLYEQPAGHYWFHNEKSRIDETPRVEVLYDMATRTIRAGASDTTGSVAFAREQERGRAESEVREQVLRVLRTTPGLSKRELHDAVHGRGTSAITLARTQLLDAGDIRTETGPRGRVSHFLVEK